MQRRKVILVLVVALGAIGWYLFRPERLFINATVNESFPASVAAQPASPASTHVVELSGRFHGVAHKSSGIATIHRFADGRRVLRLTEFETSNGPDVQVYLVAAGDANDNAAVTRAGFLPLGALKGNKGDQNYDVPADADLARHRAVTIWCRRFGVNFATAPLSRPSAEAGAAPGAGMTSSPAARFSGRFHGVAHKSAGIASIYEFPDGRRVLRLTEFETSNGPDLQVYLVAAPDANDSSTVQQAGFVALGALKGNRGGQNYDVSPNVDLSKYRAVTIWCRRFGVNFATAPLMQQ